MTRVGVITFLHNENYGSILQALALQRALSALGFDARHIDYAPSTAEKVRNLLCSGNSPRLILEGMRKRSATGKMQGGFAQFRSEQLKLTPRCPDRKALATAAAACDVVVSGSDQIWSPVWLNPAYFLDFTDKPKVAYAPSLGVEKVADERKARRIASLVKRYSAVSVREREGAEIIARLTGRDVPVLPDPVFLMDAESWRRAASQDAPQERYVLTYFIGDKASYWAETEKAAARLGCGVRVIPRTEGARQSGHPLEENVPPQRWLALIDGAAHVVTDSFHGAAFCAILNIPCTIVRRYREDDPESKNSRIDQLLRNLGTDSLEAPDWRKINARLAGMADEGKKWLLDAISQAAQQAPSEAGK